MIEQAPHSDIYETQSALYPAKPNPPQKSQHRSYSDIREVVAFSTRQKDPLIRELSLILAWKMKAEDATELKPLFNK